VNELLGFILIFMVILTVAILVVETIREGFIFALQIAGYVWLIIIGAGAALVAMIAFLSWATGTPIA
jgi:hypothetical protein